MGRGSGLVLPLMKRKQFQRAIADPFLATLWEQPMDQKDTAGEALFTELLFTGSSIQEGRKMERPATSQVV